MCVGLGCLFREVSVKDIMMLLTILPSVIFLEQMVSLLYLFPVSLSTLVF